MLQRLEAVFRGVFDTAPGTDVSGWRQLTMDKWDSLGHVTLIAALESEFGVEFSIAESLELTSYAAALQLLEEKLAEQ